ncbi:MAG: hypothetical protein ABIG84_01425 [archaeon]
MMEITDQERKQVANMAAFDGYVKLVEYQYDQTVNSLLRMCKSAIKHKNKDLLNALKETSFAWMKYFQALKKNITKGSKGKKTEEEDRMLSFIDEQIAFFELMTKEINAQMKQIK